MCLYIIHIFKKLRSYWKYMFSIFYLKLYHEHFPGHYTNYKKWEIMLVQCLSCARHCSECLTCSNLFHPHRSLWGSSCYCLLGRGGNCWVEQPARPLRWSVWWPDYWSASGLCALTVTGQLILLRNLDISPYFVFNMWWTILNFGLWSHLFPYNS